uniref:Uncharacterized protein n=1 Tax=Anguilla anguilla TaxID=7936 RepID=A0A0E9XVQ6_ANGAN
MKFPFCDFEKFSLDFCIFLFSPT